MYDSIIVPDELADVHPKQAIRLRNRWMVDHSDVIFSYVDNRSGGAYEALKYAACKGKNIYNMGKIFFKIKDFKWDSGAIEYEDI